MMARSGSVWISRQTRRVVGTLAMICLGAVAACGNTVGGDFPNRLVGSAGQLIVLDDVNEIVADPNLTADQKRSDLRDLGIEDEELINALLTL